MEFICFNIFRGYLYLIWIKVKQNTALEASFQIASKWGCYFITVSFKGGEEIIQYVYILKKIALSLKNRFQNYHCFAIFLTTVFHLFWTFRKLKELWRCVGLIQTRMKQSVLESAAIQTQVPVVWPSLSYRDRLSITKYEGCCFPGLFLDVPSICWHSHLTLFL